MTKVKTQPIRAIGSPTAASYDIVEGRAHDGRKFRILTIIDEASRECLALIPVAFAQEQREGYVAVITDEIGACYKTVSYRLEDQA